MIKIFTECSFLLIKLLKLTNSKMIEEKQQKWSASSQNVFFLGRGGGKFINPKWLKKNNIKWSKISQSVIFFLIKRLRLINRKMFEENFNKMIKNFKKYSFLHEQTAKAHLSENDSRKQYKLVRILKNVLLNLSQVAVDEEENYILWRCWSLYVVFLESFPDCWALAVWQGNKTTFFEDFDQFMLFFFRHFWVAELSFIPLLNRKATFYEDFD